MQGASLCQYIGAGIPIFHSSVHFFISLPHSLCLPISPSLSISQQAKIIQKFEVEQTLTAFYLLIEKTPINFALVAKKGKTTSK